VRIQARQSRAEAHRVPFSTADQSAPGHTGAAILIARNCLGVVDAELIERGDRRGRHAFVDAVCDPLRAEEVNAAGAILGDSGCGENACLSLRADAELSGMIAVSDHPVGTDLTDVQIVAVEFGRADAGLDAARQIAVVGAKVEIEGLGRREIGGAERDAPLVV
jgi:hypothetical protein